MATKEKNNSNEPVKISAALRGKGIAIVVSSWNDDVTGALQAGALEGLAAAGVSRLDIQVHQVPGSFELPLAAKWMAAKKDIEAVICLGCVIQGETRHFEFICEAVARGIMEVGLEEEKPVIFGVLTTDTKQQALDRAGGKYGNKGEEAAQSALQMLALKYK